VRLIRVDWPADAGGRAAWERLRLAAPTESLFLTPEWPETWTRLLGNGRALLFGVADGDKICALAPMEQTTVAGGFTVLRPLGTGVADYLDLLLPYDPSTRIASLEVLVGELIARRDAWDAVTLSGLPGESPTACDLTRVAGERGLRAATLPGYARPEIALDGDWESYLQSRPGRFRYNLRSRLRRLAERGEVRFRHIERADQVVPAVGMLAALHARRWNDQYTSTIFSSSTAGQRFYGEACRRYQERGLLDLTLLEVDGHAVAGSIGFVDRGTYYYYLPAWDPDLATLAPSSLLLAHVIERAYESGLHRFDFMLGEEPYKARWATGERHTVNLVLASPTLRGQAAYAALVGWQRARQRARSSALLQKARRYGLGRAKQIVSSVRQRLGPDWEAPMLRDVRNDLARGGESTRGSG
jgi:CelD/BcsL family acetyltransferase involved in cellulose biosynthesis